MNDSVSRPARPLRVFCLEDNPLIVLHVEQIIEEAGHAFAGALESFADLQERFSDLELDGALVDIDLADGRTGPSAAVWLADRGVPTIFMTGQENVAAQHGEASIGVVAKPISQDDLIEKLALFRSFLPNGSRDRD